MTPASIGGRPLGTCDGVVAACLTCGEEWPARDAEQASLIVALHGGLRHEPSIWASGVVGGLTREARPPRRGGRR